MIHESTGQLILLAENDQTSKLCRHLKLVGAVNKSIRMSCFDPVKVNPLQINPNMAGMEGDDYCNKVRNGYPCFHICKDSGRVIQALQHKCANGCYTLDKLKSYLPWLRPEAEKELLEDLPKIQMLMEELELTEKL